MLRGDGMWGPGARKAPPPGRDSLEVRGPGKGNVHIMLREGEMVQKEPHILLFRSCQEQG